MTSAPGRWSKMRWRFIVKTGVVLVGVATIFGTAIEAMNRWLPKDSDRPAAMIVVDDPREGDNVPRCSTFVGSARHRDGWVLWAAIHSSIGREYYFQKPLHLADNRWRMRTAIGDTDGAHVAFVIDFFYLPQRESDELEKLHGWLDGLPDGVDRDHLVRRTVIRTEDGSPCG